jgi:hypothetical protein
MELEIVDSMIEEAVSGAEEGSRLSLSLQLMEWRRRQLCDDKYAYFPDSHAWARNSGILLSINLDAFTPFQKRPQQRRRRVTSGASCR